MTIIRPLTVEGSDKYVVHLANSSGGATPAAPPKQLCPDCGMGHLRPGYCQGRDPMYSRNLKAEALPSPQKKLTKA